MNTITIEIPVVDKSMVASGLVELTKRLAEANAPISHGLLGGEFGYGADYDSPVFMMHPFCWCEKDECPWCREEDPAPNFLHKTTGFNVRWYKYIYRGMEIDANGADFVDVLADCCRHIKELKKTA